MAERPRPVQDNRPKGQKKLAHLNALRAFEAVVRHMSFAKASEELNVTPGAISQQIKLLEDYYDIRLFRREGRRIALTAAQHKFGLANVARIVVAGGGVDGDALTGDLTCTPCGGCRQAIFEASCLSGRDIEVLSANGEGSKVDRHTIGSLLPNGFGPANLNDAY